MSVAISLCRCVGNGLGWFLLFLLFKHCDFGEFRVNFLIEIIELRFEGFGGVKRRPETDDLLDVGHLELVVGLVVKVDLDLCGEGE